MTDERKGTSNLLNPDTMFLSLKEAVENGNITMDIERITSADEYARAAHEGQLRKDGSPYVTHCVAAAQIEIGRAHV